MIYELFTLNYSIRCNSKNYPHIPSPISSWRKQDFRRQDWWVLLTDNGNTLRQKCCCTVLVVITRPCKYITTYNLSSYISYWQPSTCSTTLLWVPDRSGRPRLLLLFAVSCDAQSPDCGPCTFPQPRASQVWVETSGEGGGWWVRTTQGRLWRTGCSQTQLLSMQADDNYNHNNDNNDNDTVTIIWSSLLRSSQNRAEAGIPRHIRLHWGRHQEHRRRHQRSLEQAQEQQQRQRLRLPAGRRVWSTPSPRFVSRVT